VRVGVGNIKLYAYQKLKLIEEGEQFIVLPFLVVDAIHNYYLNTIED
jgi:hypothetical protein